MHLPLPCSAAHGRAYPQSMHGCITEKPHTVNATSITEPEARALADAINQVSAKQPPSEAMKLVEMALARAPEQPIVLNSAGGHMLRIGKPAQARELYQRAIAIDAKSKVLWTRVKRVS